MSLLSLPTLDQCIGIATGAGAIGVRVVNEADVRFCEFNATTAIRLEDEAIAHLRECGSYTVSLGTGATIDPVTSDRAVWDTAGYPARHANDIDDPAGIHHTLGTDSDQAAAGNHGHAANAITFTPAGALAADDVQAALEELDSEKAATGHTHTALVPAGGTTGQALKKSSNTDYDYTWQDDETGGGSTAGKIEINFDGGGAALTTGIKVDFQVPYDLTITDWTVVADQSGSLVIDLWLDTYANYPPTATDTVTGSDKPTLSSQQKNTSSALTGWDTTWTGGVWGRVNIDSAATVQRATLTLSYTRS